MCFHRDASLKDCSGGVNRGMKSRANLCFDNSERTTFGTALLIGFVTYCKCGGFEIGGVTGRRSFRSG